MDRLSQLEESVAELSGALCNALGIVQQEAEGREQRATSAACEEAEREEVEAWKRGPIEWGTFVAKQAQVLSRTHHPPPHGAERSSLDI